MSRDLRIDELLADLGYREAAAQRAARAVLEEAGLTNSRKSRIAATKLGAIKDALAARFLLVCTRPSCRATVTGDPRTIIDVTRPTDCSVCAGSANNAALKRAIAGLAERNWRRVVVVGGSPSTRQALIDLVGDELELRLVTGDERLKRDARADLAWADLVVIWGATELNHSVSMSYTNEAQRRRIVTCPRRGIEALAATMLDAARRDADGDISRDPRDR